jgi:hypothetical protein
MDKIYSVTEKIVYPLLRRKKRKKASIIIVTFWGNEPPIEIVNQVEKNITEDGYNHQKVYFSDLAPNPVINLIERKNQGYDTFSVICDPQTLKGKEGKSLITALNIHRNTFVEESLSAIFWIPRDQVRIFSQYASNFLDYRTRFVDIDEERIDNRKDRERTSSPYETFPFVDREDEIREILSDYAPPYFLIDAPAGYGKTVLLTELRKRFEQEGWLCSYSSIDESDTFFDFINRLSKQFDISIFNQKNKHLLREEFPLQIKKLFYSQNGHGLALLINFGGKPSLPILKRLLTEFIPTLHGKLTELKVFFKGHNPFRVVIAGRNLAQISYTIQYPIKTKIIELFPLNYTQTQQIVVNYLPKNIGDSKIKLISAHLFYFSGGHPNIISKVLRKYSEIEIQSDAFFDYFRNSVWQQLFRYTVEEIRKEIPHELREIMDKLSVFRFLSYDILEHLIKDKNIIWQKKPMVLGNKLIRTYYYYDGGFLKGDTIRRILLIRLRYEYPDELTCLCKNAMNILEKNLKDSSIHSPEIWTIEYLFQFLQSYSNEIEEKDNREKIRNNFFGDFLTYALELYLSRDIDPETFNRKKKSLLDRLKKDWEFQFTLNYYLRETHFNNQPFQKLLDIINEF